MESFSSQAPSEMSTTPPSLGTALLKGLFVRTRQCSVLQGRRKNLSEMVLECCGGIVGSFSGTFASFLSNYETVLTKKQVKWETRLYYLAHSVYKISVDRTDFCILEPTLFDPKYYSHKFKGPGLRYEVGFGIGNGLIV